MSNITKEQLSNNDSSQKEEPNTPNQNPYLLKIKRERNENTSSVNFQECESGEKILSFSLSNKLMTYIYENVILVFPTPFHLEELPLVILHLSPHPFNFYYYISIL